MRIQQAITVERREIYSKLGQKSIVISKKSITNQKSKNRKIYQKKMKVPIILLKYYLDLMNIVYIINRTIANSGFNMALKVKRPTAQVCPAKNKYFSYLKSGAEHLTSRRRKILMRDICSGCAILFISWSKKYSRFIVLQKY